MRAVEGTVPAKAQTGLKDSCKAQGTSSRVSAVPESDLFISTAGPDVQLGAARSLATCRRLSFQVPSMTLATAHIDVWQGRSGRQSASRWSARGLLARLSRRDCDGRRRARRSAVGGAGAGLRGPVPSEHVPASARAGVQDLRVTARELTSAPAPLLVATRQ
jgi:hypothetical protein